MKKTKKKVAVIAAVAMFAVMMALSISTSINSTNFSLVGIEALAGGTTSPFDCRDESGEWTWCSDGFSGFTFGIYTLQDCCCDVVDLASPADPFAVCGE